MAEVKIIADSVSPQGIRLTTFHLRYWRAIHAELMTHRVFSRNARSSRAVPSKILLTEEVFVPQFGMNKPGMQSTEKLTLAQQYEAQSIWIDLAKDTRIAVSKLQALGVHKQWANRPLEWFGWIDVQVTATWWKNFFTLRISEYAQPELDELAQLMLKAMEQSQPVLRQPGSWHLPWVTEDEREGGYTLDELKMISTARSARLSYAPFDGKADFVSEMARYEKLVVSQPVHASPAEHQATPDTRVNSGKWKDDESWGHPQLHGNFEGWIQYRKTIPHEAIMETRV